LQPQGFDVDVTDDGTTVVLALRGELDLATVGLVRDAYARRCAGRPRVIVDLSGLEFMDSSGLRVLLELKAGAGRQDLRYVPPGDRVGRLLDMTGVRPLLTWVDEPGGAAEA
jgi:anti-sigma B factor antagonist